MHTQCRWAWQRRFSSPGVPSKRRTHRIRCRAQIREKHVQQMRPRSESTAQVADASGEKQYYCGMARESGNPFAEACRGYGGASKR